MRLYTKIFLALFLTSLLPVDALSKQSSQQPNTGSIQKDGTFQDDYHHKRSLFALHNTKKPGEITHKRQYRPVPLEDIEQYQANLSAQDSPGKRDSEYFKTSGLLEISLPIKKLIFPFHFHW